MSQNRHGVLGLSGDKDSCYMRDNASEVGYAVRWKSGRLDDEQKYLYHFA